MGADPQPQTNKPSRVQELLRKMDASGRLGTVTGVQGTVIRAKIPNARLGELWNIEREDQPPLEAEVIAFDAQGALLMPLGRLESVAHASAVHPGPSQIRVPAGEQVRGRVLDALGRPYADGSSRLSVELASSPLMAEPPNPLTRRRVKQVVTTGIRAIDGLLTAGRGQRLGIFAAAGVGKSTLLSMLTRNVDADVVVMGLIGERGREVRGFIEDDLGEAGMSKCTLVVSTSDQPAVLRLKAAYTATAIAEHARSEGKNVVLLMDSLTRFARALREIGLAAGEPPGRLGYPASVFATLPRLLERAGNDDRGSITAFYTVLVEGDDMTDPIADETMGILDGHIILSRALAARGHYPAIDVSRSKSRLMKELVSREHAAAAAAALRTLAVYEENYDKISLGVYSGGSDPDVDLAIRRIGQTQAFLRQQSEERSEFSETLRRLAALQHESG